MVRRVPAAGRVRRNGTRAQNEHNSKTRLWFQSGSRRALKRAASVPAAVAVVFLAFVERRIFFVDLFRAKECAQWRGRGLSVEVDSVFEDWASFKSIGFVGEKKLKKFDRKVMNARVCAGIAFGLLLWFGVVVGFVLIFSDAWIFATLGDGACGLRSPFARIGITDIQVNGNCLDDATEEERDRFSLFLDIGNKEIGAGNLWEIGIANLLTEGLVLSYEELLEDIEGCEAFWTDILPAEIETQNLQGSAHALLVEIEPVLKADWSNLNQTLHEKANDLKEGWLVTTHALLFSEVIRDTFPELLRLSEDVNNDPQVLSEFLLYAIDALEESKTDLCQRADIAPAEEDCTNLFEFLHEIGDLLRFEEFKTFLGRNDFSDNEFLREFIRFIGTEELPVNANMRENKVCNIVRLRGALIVEFTGPCSIAVLLSDVTTHSEDYEATLLTFMNSLFSDLDAEGILDSTSSCTSIETFDKTSLESFLSEEKKNRTLALIEMSETACKAKKFVEKEESAIAWQFFILEECPSSFSVFECITAFIAVESEIPVDGIDSTYGLCGRFEIAQIRNSLPTRRVLPIFNVGVFQSQGRDALRFCSFRDYFILKKSLGEKSDALQEFEQVLQTCTRNENLDACMSRDFLFEVAAEFFDRSIRSSDEILEECSRSEDYLQDPFILAAQILVPLSTLIFIVSCIVILLGIMKETEILFLCASTLSMVGFACLIAGLFCTHESQIGRSISSRSNEDANGYEGCPEDRLCFHVGPVYALAWVSAGITFIASISLLLKTISLLCTSETSKIERMETNGELHRRFGIEHMDWTIDKPEGVSLRSTSISGSLEENDPDSSGSESQAALAQI